MKGLHRLLTRPFRETARKRKLFMRYGAICVDMEASAFFSIARYHGKHAAAIFYAGDLVGERWNPRWEEEHEEKQDKVVRQLLEYSLEALLKAPTSES